MADAAVAPVDADAKREIAEDNVVIQMVAPADALAAPADAADAADAPVSASAPASSAHSSEDDEPFYGSEPSDSDLDIQNNSGFGFANGSRQSIAGSGFGSGFANGSGSGFANGFGYDKLSYIDVRNQINLCYEQDIVHRYSAALDILASYIRGQRTIYTETRSYLSTILDCLMFPSLFISGSITVLQTVLTNSPYILAGLSATVTLLLAIINYSKLDSAAEAHKISCYQYDKLQSMIEFQSGQVLLFSNPILNNEMMVRHCEQEKKRIRLTFQVVDAEGNVVMNASEEERARGVENAENAMLSALYQERLQAEGELISTMRKLMVEIESDIADIKATNQFTIPQKVRYNYPLLYNTNVFAIIKKIDDYRAKTITDLKHVKNELRFINAYQRSHGQGQAQAQAQAQAQGQAQAQAQKYKKRASDLFKQKKRIIDIILFLNTAFSMIDKMFQQEILNANIRSEYWFRFYIYDRLNCCCCSKYLKHILPPKYIEPEMSGGDVFQEIMGFGGSTSS